MSLKTYCHQVECGEVGLKVVSYSAFAFGFRMTMQCSKLLLAPSAPVMPMSVELLIQSSLWVSQALGVSHHTWLFSFNWPACGPPERKGHKEVTHEIDLVS